MPHLSLALLGFPEILLDSVPVRFETQKILALLIYLAVEAAHAHSREELTGLLWSEQSEQSARNNLRVSLFRLRKVLRERADTPFLRVTGESIQINLESPHSLDVAAFHDGLAETRRHRHDRVENCGECAARLAQAVALYRGDFLHGFAPSDSAPFEEWAVIQREALRQRVLNALDLLVAFHESRGEHPETCGYARRQIELEPWRESAHRQLMRGLALTGDRSGALAQYETCRRLMAQELGTAPEEETRALFERIRDGEFAIPQPADASILYHLPAPITPFIGREKELTEINARLDQSDYRLLTLVGLGGMGKTRLAIQAARARKDAFPHGVFFVSLAPLGSAAAMIPAIAEALGFDFTPGRDAKLQLFNYLREKRLLLVLDNFENLLGPSTSLTANPVVSGANPSAEGSNGAALVTEMLRFAPHAQIIVTSRERLNVQGEYLYPVQGLDYPRALVADAAQYSAVRLFLQSVRRVQSNWTFDAAHADAVVRICRLVEGMPLGLELAAAWTEMLPLDEIAAEIEKNLDFLQSDWQDVPERQRSMRAVFEWSWNLLSESDRAVLRRLSIFRGGFTRDAAQSVAGASPRTLTTLVRKSLLRLGTHEVGAPRYDLHELVRQYAFEKLQVAGEKDATLERHLDFFLQLAVEGECELCGPNQSLWTERLEVEHDNLRAALGWTLRAGDEIARRLKGLCLAGALWWFWVLRCHFAEGRAWLEQALAITEGGSTEFAEARVKILWRLAYLVTMPGDGKQATDLAAEALARCREISDSYGVGISLLVLGNLARDQDDLAHSKELMQASLEVFRELRDQWGIGHVFYSLGWTLVAEGNYREARTIAEQSLAIRREIGVQAGIASSLVFLGNVAYLQGDFRQATPFFEEGLALFRQVKDKWGLAFALGRLSEMSQEQGAWAGASGYVHEELALSRELGDREMMADALRNRGMLAWRQSAFEEAETHVELALNLYREIGDERGTRATLLSRGQIAESLGDYVRAREDYEDAGRLAGELPRRRRSLWTLHMARLSHHVGENDAAGAYSQLATQWAQTSGDRYNLAHALTELGHAQVELDQFTQALDAYAQALELYQEMGLAHLATEPRAGLARMHLRNGELEIARAQVEEILHALAQSSLEGTAEPSRIFLTCYRVLAASHDPRARDVLNSVHDWLQTRAAQIRTAERRRMFLENVATHRQIEDAWARNNRA